MTTYLEADTKFWEITVDGCDFTTRYGKLGASGKSGTKSWPSEDKCQKEADKLIRAKEKKGYARTDGGGASAPAKEAPAKEAPAKKAPAKKAPAKKKAAAGGTGVFAGCVFCISGTLSKPKSAMTKIIEDAGGKVGSGCTKNTTHLLTSDADFLGKTAKVSKAEGSGIPVLHEDFVFDSIKGGKKVSEADYSMASMHGGDGDDDKKEEAEEPPKKKAKTAGTNAGTNTTYLEADTKFWEIVVSGNEFTTRYGKLGASGASSTKSWPDEAKCQKEAEKLIRAKKKKGYA